MRVLRIGKLRNTFKQRCCMCNSKLEFTKEDLTFDFGPGNYYFSCPVCKTGQCLNNKNELLRRKLDYVKDD